MSQRLHIGPTEDKFYDCVLTSTRNAHRKMKKEWLAYKDGWYAGPWKVRIADMALFREVEPDIRRLFHGLDKQYPECVWTFYHRKSQITHPTQKELGGWIAKRR